jgi:exonuclease III
MPKCPGQSHRCKGHGRAVKATVTCLQETKLQVIDKWMVSDMLGPRDSKTISFLPADVTSSGILIAASDDHFQLLSSSRSKYSLTVRIQALQGAFEWTLTSVYGSQQEIDKIIFLEEIKALRQAIHREWLLCGDFNLIYKTEDKSKAG